MPHEEHVVRDLANQVDVMDVVPWDGLALGGRALQAERLFV